MLEGVRVVALSINSHVMNRLKEIKSVIFRLVGSLYFRGIHFSRCLKVFIKQKSEKTPLNLQCVNTHYAKFEFKGMNSV